MKTGNPIRAALSVAAVAIATGVFTTSAQADFTIYSDNFSGNGGVLNGTTPDIAFTLDPFANLSWYAGETTFFDDGTVDATPGVSTRGGGGAYLPFEPEAGQIYTASADINNLTNGWVGFGFVQNPYNPWIDDDSGRHEQGALGSQWFQVFPGSVSIVDSATSDVVGGAPFILDTVGGLTGTNSFEIVFDATDVNNVHVSFSINDTEEFTYNAGPLATIGYENSGGFPGVGQVDYGIRGMGFSVSEGALVDGIDNLLLTTDADLPPVLGLEVNTSSGEMTIKGNGSSADNINSYQITSDLGQLDPSEGKWNSLDDQNLGTFAGIAGDFTKDDLVNSVDLTDPVDGWEARFGADLDGGDFLNWQRNLGSSGTSTDWEEGGAVGPSFLGEAILVGESTIAAAASISLETPYTGPAEGDLKFIYRTADGLFAKGEVTYVGAVAAAVPEALSSALVAVGLLGMGTRRRK